MQKRTFRDSSRVNELYINCDPDHFGDFVMSYVEKYLNRVIHDSVKTFITPLVCLVTIVPLTLIVFGPIGVNAGNAIASAILAIFSFNPMLAGAVIAALWQILVIFGIHWGLCRSF